MQPLLPAFRRALRARAHHLHPVVSVGHQGLTPAVLHEADVALSAHELIKVRVLADDRGERDALLSRICETLDCAPVQQIGKLLVLWRPRPQQTAPAPEKPPARPRPHAKPPAEPSRPQATAATRKAAGTGVGFLRRHAAGGKAPPGVPRAASRRRRRAPG